MTAQRRPQGPPPQNDEITRSTTRDISASRRSGSMKQMWQLALLASLAAAPAAAQGQQASGDPLTAALKAQFDGVSRNVKEAAEKMPDDKFSYQATKEVRTFGGFV